MLKKSLVSTSLAALLLCASLFGCASGDASSASSSAASSAASSQSSQSSQADSTAQATIEVSVEIDTDLLEGTPEAQALAPYRGPQEFVLEAGSTAYDALVATGVQIDGTPSYVTSINGAGEGLAGDASGWMYMVDDEIPSVAANEYELAEGDQVIWYYGSWS